MPYTTIVAGSTITSSWANANVRDQVVTSFANAAARASAISSPIEGMVTYLQDTNRTDFYNGTVWQPLNGASVKAIRSSDQTITTGITTTINWNSAAYDSHGFWSGANPTRLTAPWLGFYTISTTISWNSTTSGTSRRTGIAINGTIEEQQRHRLENITDTEALRQNCSAAGVQLSAGGFAEIQVFHNAGGDRTIDAGLCSFRMVYNGPA
jgi:hypothetical protein